MTHPAPPNPPGLALGRLVRVTVAPPGRFDHLVHVCMFARLVSGEIVVKCGRCLTGKVKPRVGARCKVCKSRVHEVLREHESHRRFPWPD